jgi:ABC-type glutathione transport system ATPase component
MAFARIMLVNPRFIMADEPTSRLDPSVQANIIRLIADLSHTQGLRCDACFPRYRTDSGSL